MIKINGSIWKKNKKFYREKLWSYVDMSCTNLVYIDSDLIIMIIKHH